VVPEHNLNLVFSLTAASINHLTMDSKDWYRNTSAYKHAQIFWVKTILLIKITKQCEDENLYNQIWRLYDSRSLYWWEVCIEMHNKLFQFTHLHVCFLTACLRRIIHSEERVHQTVLSRTYRLYTFFILLWWKNAAYEYLKKCVNYII
jgi:hypothetical protein